MKSQSRIYEDFQLLTEKVIVVEGFSKKITAYANMQACYF